MLPPDTPADTPAMAKAETLPLPPEPAPIERIVHAAGGGLWVCRGGHWSLVSENPTDWAIGINPALRGVAAFLLDRVAEPASRYTERDIWLSFIANFESTSEHAESQSLTEALAWLNKFTDADPPWIAGPLLARARAAAVALSRFANALERAGVITAPETED